MGMRSCIYPKFFLPLVNTVEVGQQSWSDRAVHPNYVAVLVTGERVYKDPYRTSRQFWK